jgi:hypothetical protein
MAVLSSKLTLLDPSGYVAPLLGIRNYNDSCLVVVLGGVEGVGSDVCDGAILTMDVLFSWLITSVSPFFRTIVYITRNI